MNKTVSLKSLGLKFEYPQIYDETKENASYFIESIKHVNKLPFDKVNIYYSDLIWDFSGFSKLNIRRKNLKFRFEHCNETFRDDLKNFVFLKILEDDVKIRSIHRSFIILYDFFNHAEKNNYYHVQDIDDTEIIKFLNTYKKQTVTSIAGVKQSLKTFFTYYSVNFQYPLTKSRLEILNVDNKIIKAHRKQNKTPDIPKDYFDKFLSTIIQVANDENEDKYIRAVACMYIILSQTGLRVSESLSIEVNSLETTYILNGEKAYYLTYKVWKNCSGNNNFVTYKTYVNELTKHAYELLVKIYKQDRIKTKVNYLYLGNEYIIKNNLYPLDPDSFSQYQIEFCSYINKYFQIIDLPDDIYPTMFRKKAINNMAIKKYNPNAKTITMPRNYQFRVHVCTELYNKGVPLKYIEKFMAHLSNEMQGYYVRPTKKNPQEDMAFAMDTLSKIVKGETKPLGATKGFTEKIEEFIKENNYNVEKDLDAICKSLAKKIPIRQKTGGVCIKSSMLRECSKDAKTNEFYCAYDVCPNIFHFYYMANISYRQAKELVDTININRKNGFIKQVQKETNMLSTIIKKKLEPELEELKNMINKKGTSAILMEYPDLKYIVENLEDIYKEIDRWKQMIEMK